MFVQLYLKFNSSRDVSFFSDIAVVSYETVVPFHGDVFKLTITMYSSFLVELECLFESQESRG